MKTFINTFAQLENKFYLCDVNILVITTLKIKYYGK